MSEGKTRFRSLAGMKDLLPEEALLWQYVEEKAKEIFSLYGYKPIHTPLLEDSGLFNRSLGKEAEIVKKQMFLIKRQKETYCLRPEATAAVVRAYLENNLDKTNTFVKLYYSGPMFRAERPQKGRLRQFHHLGVEALGSDSPYLDSEIIALANRILGELQVNGFQIKLNSLGCVSDREKFKSILQLRLKNKLESLCPDCKERYRRNVFRVLDCKNEVCRQIAQGLGLEYSQYLCDDCSNHFSIVRANLDKLKINYAVCLTLVRGLDYYSRTVFEISHPALGSQDAIGAGGRYDNLIHELGGPKLGAVGLALGVERLLLVSGLRSPAASQGIKVFIVTLGNTAKEQGFILLDKLRKVSIGCDMDYEDKSLKGQMRRANDLGVRFTALIGDEEIRKEKITLKDMQSGAQEEVSLGNFIEGLKKRL